MVYAMAELPTVLLGVYVWSLPLLGLKSTPQAM